MGVRGSNILSLLQPRWRTSKRSPVETQGDEMKKMDQIKVHNVSHINVVKSYSDAMATNGPRKPVTNMRSYERTDK